MRLAVLALALLACAPRGLIVDGQRRQPDLITQHGLRVVNLSGRPVDVATLDAEVERALAAWSNAVWLEHLFLMDEAPLGNAEPSFCNVRQAVAGAWLVLRPPGTVYHDGQNVGGVARPNGVIEVEHRSDDYTRTSLAHELGHIVAWACLRSSSNDYLRELRARYGVP
jgi:hypothetical protein